MSAAPAPLLRRRRPGGVPGDAGHHQADPLPADARVDDTHDPTPVHDGDAVAEGEHLVELRRDDEDSRALVTLGDDPPVHVLDRADVEATGRLRRHEQLDRPAELTGEHDLLLVAARERRDRIVDRAGADVELLHAPLGVLPARRRGCATPGRRREDRRTCRARGCRPAASGARGRPSAGPRARGPRRRGGAGAGVACVRSLPATDDACRAGRGAGP